MSERAAWSDEQEREWQKLMREWRMEGTYATDAMDSGDDRAAMACEVRGDRARARADAMGRPRWVVIRRADDGLDISGPLGDVDLTLWTDRDALALLAALAAALAGGAA